MDDDVQLISDGDGLAVIGEPAAVERFFAANELPTGRDLGLKKLWPVIGVAASVIQGGSEVAANHGRWIKLTKESAAALANNPR